MPALIILIIILGAVIGLITFFLIKSILAPQKIATLATLVKQNKNTAAIRTAKKIIARDPRNPEAHYLLGLAYLADGKPELAMIELRTVNQISIFTNLCPEIPFRKKIAELYSKFNQPEEALKEYLLLTKKEPGSADNFFMTGMLFEERSRSAKAVEFYRRAIQVDARHGQAHTRLGLLLYREKKPVEARTFLETAVKLNPENCAANFHLGRILKENHDFTTALAAFERAQKGPEFKTKSLIERGGCFMSMNYFDKASGELERAIKLAGETEENEVLYARYFLAICRERTRDIEGAIEQWEKISEKKPNFKDVAEKLNQYQDMRHDDHIKDFLIARQEDFTAICRDIAGSLGMTVQDVTEIPDGCQIIGVESQSKWRNARRVPKLVRILRMPELVEEAAVRAFHAEMKNLGITRGIIITTSAFSRSAMGFVESRPIELWNKDKLQEILTGLDENA